MRGREGLLGRRAPAQLSGGREEAAPASEIRSLVQRREYSELEERVWLPTGRTSRGCSKVDPASLRDSLKGIEEQRCSSTGHFEKGVGREREQTDRVDKTSGGVGTGGVSATTVPGAGSRTTPKESYSS
ncbi:hypothetical protein HPB50_018555 [Hyalomma asiaticum]|uniref:Uncharacterized protein n=1 Tax=Hyalomma asiaticum TaxID=266040 RepID=A0ACB7TKR1_HYAAI|nr:hypothetical protein HPB50_018555 [Hyalomma asiaticum]